MARAESEVLVGPEAFRGPVARPASSPHSRRRFDASLLVVWSVAVGSTLWLLDATWMIANALLLGAPLVYILTRSPQVEAVIRWRFVVRFVVFITVFFDYLCVKYEAWAGLSLFPTVAGVNAEQVVWTALIIPLTLAVNEYFFSRRTSAPPCGVARPILIAFFLSGFVIALVPPFHGWLADYTYLKIGLFLYPMMFALVAVTVPSALREVLLTGLAMAAFNLGFELLALHNGFWTFPGEYVGEVELLGYAFPTEEMVFLIGFCSAGVVAVYAMYKNWKSLAQNFS